MSEEKKDTLKSLMDELENVVGNLELTKDFHGIFIGETDKTDMPDWGYKNAYGRIRTLNYILFDRIDEATETLGNIFRCLHETLIERNVL